MATRMPEVEVALRRVLAIGADGAAADTALAGSRRAVVDALRAAQDTLATDDIAQAVGIHANTVRHHLDVLIAAGLVERAESRAQGRGRPKARYRISAAAAAPYAQLGSDLEAALAKYGEDKVVTETAERWLATVTPVATAEDLDSAVDGAIDALREVGFDARRDAIGDTIVVSECPYASLIAEHPMICTLHAELISGALRETGQPVTLDALDVWVRPRVCRARLNRPDTTPDFIAGPSLESAKEHS